MFTYQLMLTNENQHTALITLILQLLFTVESVECLDLERRFNPVSLNFGCSEEVVASLKVKWILSVFSQFSKVITHFKIYFVS